MTEQEVIELVETMKQEASEDMRVNKEKLKDFGSSWAFSREYDRANERYNVLEELLYRMKG